MIAALPGLPVAAGGCLVHGLVDAIRHRRAARALPFLAVSMLAVGLLVLVLTTTYRLIN